MVLLCKSKALYVKCCIIANGVTDSQGDCLNTEDIKKIFTSFNNQDNFEVYHNDIPIKEVSLLENYISTTDEAIGTAVVPRGSWNAVIRVDNPEIQESLLTGEFKGVSLSNRIAPKCQGNLTGTVRYKDVADAECIIPLLISFVENGANGYGLHVMDYPAYIKKSKDIVIDKGDKIMDFKEFIDGLKSLIKQAEDTPEEEPVVEKEDKAQDEEPVEETTTTATEEKDVVVEETEEKEPAVEKAEEAEETAEEEATEEEAEIKKEDEAEEEVADEKEEAEIIKEEATGDEDLEAKITAIVEKVLAEKLAEKEDAVEEENPDPEKEPEDEDTPKITKSEKVVITEENQIKQSNYYKMSGRDPLTGKKIRN